MEKDFSIPLSFEKRADLESAWRNLSACDNALYLVWNNGDKLVIEYFSNDRYSFEFYTDSIAGWVLNSEKTEHIFLAICEKLDVDINLLKQMCSCLGTSFNSI